MSASTQGQNAVAHSALRVALTDLQTALSNASNAQVVLRFNVWHDQNLGEYCQRVTDRWLNELRWCLLNTAEGDLHARPRYVDGAESLWIDHEELLRRLQLSNRVPQTEAIVTFREASVQAKVAWNQFLGFWHQEDRSEQNDPSDNDSGFGDEDYESSPSAVNRPATQAST
ncbi:hypothetical protein QFC20_003814 [Naganishia adeliensis]|uniref:Uncharacterized protein n=1 Tax=Naganishia adeliensis TaxID=92952 RepID=A0ACC2W7C3_9TREE|nr:hypothetical protein QFC20_003814 [Naganishia adeliensis]